MKFITLHLSQSRARIVLRSPTFSKCARLPSASRRRLALRVPTFTTGRRRREIEIASSEDSSTRGGLSRRYEACIRPTGTKDEAEDEDRETTEEERKEYFASEEDGRRDARLSPGRAGKRRRLRKGEVGGGYKVTRVQNRAPRARARASERASARGEARLRFPRCLLAARPRRGSLACYSTLCSYAIRATLRLRKAWRNERPGRTRRGTDGERRRVRGSEKERKAEWSEEGGAHR